MASGNGIDLPRQRTFLGHPLGLYVLFFTEMWERFSYYGMRALLMLYMLYYLRWSQKDASSHYKIYTSLVYVTPILGGFLADRWLGNRLAVIIGAVLMAIGHFLMGFEEYPIFIAALIFLIMGNGFFKPNMSTQVGRLYPANDGRRDGAYTIFYMGINLGAFFSPLVCGWLATNTVGGYHSGFTMAGIGMFLGLAIYLLGQPLIREVSQDVHVTHAGDSPEAALTEAQAERKPSVLGALAQTAPMILYVLAAGLIAACPYMLFVQEMPLFDALMLAIAGGCLALIAFISSQVHGAVRDRVLVIMVLGIFVMFFWAAFEQAGNVLNVWADQHTDRYLTQEAKAPTVIPEVQEDKPKEEKKEEVSRPGFVERFINLFTGMVTLKGGGEEKSQSFGEMIETAVNPVPTTAFQAINALAIFLLAPLFAWLWIALDRRGWQPSIPMKMTLGLLMMSASMAIMMGSANRENQPTTVTVRGAGLPEGVVTEKENKVAIKVKDKTEEFHAGRLTYDAASKRLTIHGVLPENERDDLIEATVPKAFREKVEELQKKSKDIDDKTVKSVEVTIVPPPGFDMRYAGIKKSVVKYDQDGKKLIAYQPLAEKEVKGLMVAAGDEKFRDTVHELYVKSADWRVSPWWLFWSYILATFGELCLSPVGLSMVSKLAPAKFATMLMGVWLLTSSFGNFAAGALGEIWGTIPPIQFFLLSTVVVAGAAVVLWVLVHLLVKMMHGVK